MDSFAQHLAAAMGVKSTVCWVTTKPKVFGYKLHDNIQANPFTNCLLYTSPSPRDRTRSRMPSSA